MRQSPQSPPGGTARGSPGPGPSQTSRGGCPGVGSRGRGSPSSAFGNPRDAPATYLRPSGVAAAGTRRQPTPTSSLKTSAGLVGIGGCGPKRAGAGQAGRGGCGRGLRAPGSQPRRACGTSQRPRLRAARALQPGKDVAGRPERPRHCGTPGGRGSRTGARREAVLPSPETDPPGMRKIFYSSCHGR